jgi:hypothetical protein
MPLASRLRESIPVAALHLLASALLAAMLAAVIFRVWYRPPYDALAGGRLLFLLAGRGGCGLRAPADPAAFHTQQDTRSTA